jgi:hypothetical protein
LDGEEIKDESKPGDPNQPATSKPGEMKKEEVKKPEPKKADPKAKPQRP